jgi:hypothetical protein
MLLDKLLIVLSLVVVINLIGLTVAVIDLIGLRLEVNVNGR